MIFMMPFLIVMGIVVVDKLDKKDGDGVDGKAATFFKGDKVEVKRIETWEKVEEQVTVRRGKR